MKIVWSPEALFDLADLRAYIAEDNPVAARQVVVAILDATELVANYPASGRPGRVPKTRELVIPKIPIIVPYRVRGKVLEVLRIYHQARRWPDHF